MGILGNVGNSHRSIEGIEADKPERTNTSTQKEFPECIYHRR